MTETSEFSLLSAPFSRSVFKHTCTPSQDSLIPLWAAGRLSSLSKLLEEGGRVGWVGLGWCWGERKMGGGREGGRRERQSQLAEERKLCHIQEEV